jgi:MFS family permease
MSASKKRDTYFLRNVIGVSGVEFVWGLGLPIVLESTFLQLFIKTLGATNFMIGLIPVFFFVGSSIFALVSSYYTAHLLFKKMAVILLHVASGISLICFGLFLMVTNQLNQALIAFFISYGVFSLFIGMLMPAWMNYLVHIFSEKKSVSGIAYMNIAQNGAKLIGSLVIAKIVDRYAFSFGASSYVFLGISLLFSLGSLFFLMTHEVSLDKDQLPVQKLNIIRYTVQSAKIVLGDKNFLRFLIGDFDFYAVVTVISFYANYATLYRQIDPAIAAGVFVACIYIGAIASNFLLGSLQLLDLKKNYMVYKGLSFLAIMILFFLLPVMGIHYGQFYPWVFPRHSDGFIPTNGKKAIGLIRLDRSFCHFTPYHFTAGSLPSLDIRPISGSYLKSGSGFVQTAVPDLCRHYYFNILFYT